MNDQQSTVADLRKLVDAFVAERQWHQFHTPKNLAMALSIEAAELMEHFQWLTIEESQAVAKQPVELAAVAEELADVVAYACALANSLGIDIAAALDDKMVKNAVKYPAEASRGKYKL